MSRPEIFRRSVRDMRWQVFWYGIGLGLIALVDVSVYPAYHDQLANFNLPEAFKALLGDVSYGTPKGFLTAEFFSWVPALLAVFAIMAGTSALAGEEASGTLDLLLAQPISRTRLALEKMAAILVATAGLAVLIFASWLVCVPFTSIDISLFDLAVATFNLVPLVAFFAVLAMAAAAVLPDRRLATGVVAGVAVAGYFLNYLANIVDVLKPLRFISPFYYHDGANVLSQGIEPWRLVVLLGATVIFAGIALAAFGRRDIGVYHGLTPLWRKRHPTL